MEGLENTITVMLVFGGAAALLWVIDKLFGLFSEKKAAKARHSSKLSYLIIGITVVGVVFTLYAFDNGHSPSSSSGYGDDDDGCVGSMRC